MHTGRDTFSFLNALKALENKNVFYFFPYDLFFTTMTILIHADIKYRLDLKLDHS